MEFYERKGGNKKVECSAFVVDLILPLMITTAECVSSLEWNGSAGRWFSNNCFKLWWYDCHFHNNLTIFLFVWSDDRQNTAWAAEGSGCAVSPLWHRNSRWTWRMIQVFPTRRNTRKMKRVHWPIMIYTVAGNIKTLLTTPSYHFVRLLPRMMRERSRWFIYRYRCVPCATCFPYITVSWRSEVPICGFLEQCNRIYIHGLIKGS